MTTTDGRHPDEFSFLAEECAEFGLTWDGAPAVRRVDTDVSGSGSGVDGGGTVSALVWGDPPADLVLLHGAGLNAHTWTTTVVASARPAVAIDLPGHGSSSWRDDADYRAEVNAATLAPVVERLAPDALVVVGQSLGGLTAIALASLRPELARALVVVDVRPGLVAGSGNQVRDFLAGATSFASRDEIVERALSFGFGPSRRAVERGVFLNTRVRDDGTVGFKHHLANLGQGVTAPFATDFTALWPAAEALSVPVVLVRATRGFLSDEVVAEFLDRVRTSTLVTVEAGHNVQEEAPVALAEAIVGVAG